jgi:hypothetical protein
VSLSAFKAHTVNHKPWSEPEYGFEMLQGDCPKCHSSLLYDLGERTSCYEPRDVSDADAARVHAEYQALTLAQWPAEMVA